MSSIQAECRDAMNRLAARGITFTERDVVAAASMPNWLPREFVKAGRAAYAVLQSDYRKGRLCRFGPVGVTGDDDYVRLDSKVIYAGATRGPAVVETPNGVFHRMMAEDDKISRVGRRPGIDRNDFIPWDQQGEHEPVRESEDSASEWNEAQLDSLADALVPRVAEKVAALTATVR